MTNSYLYDDVPVLKNKLGIKDKNTLDLIEAEQSRVNMMLLYEQGFHNFASEGLQSIHHSLFGDIYDWAGKLRIINIEKREKLLAGLSVLYSDNEKIPDDLILKNFIIQSGTNSLKAVSFQKSPGSSLRFGEYIHFAKEIPALWL